MKWDEENEENADVIPLDTFLDFTPSISADSFTRNLFGEFYALVEAGKKSLRAIELASEVIKLNCANYTAWQYRRWCISELEFSMNQLMLELGTVDVWCAKNPKSYQVWYHRRWVIDAIWNHSQQCATDLLEKELGKIEKLIEVEPKCYNAWSHRGYLAGLFNLFGSNRELEFTEKLIENDIRNNSAWSYRREAIRLHPCFDFDREFDFVLSKLHQVLDNESVWLYLRSLPGWRDHSGCHGFLLRFHSLLQTHAPVKNLSRDALETIILMADGDHNSLETQKVISALLEKDTIRHSRLKLRYVG